MKVRTSRKRSVFLSPTPPLSKKRGRPSKASASTLAITHQPLLAITNGPTSPSAPAPKKKNSSAVAIPMSGTKRPLWRSSSVPAPKKKAGRPRKNPRPPSPKPSTSKQSNQTGASSKEAESTEDEEVEETMPKNPVCMRRVRMLQLDKITKEVKAEIKTVTEAAKEVAKRNEEYFNKTGKDALKAALALPRPKLPTYSASHYAKMKKSISDHSGASSFERDDHGRAVPVYNFDIPEEPSRMNHFCYVSQNLRGKDDLFLSHIPHVDDPEFNEAHFLDTIYSLFPEGIHGAVTDSGRMTHRMLYEMLKDIGFDRLPQQRKDAITVAIRRLYPNQTAKMDIAETFERLSLVYDSRPRLPEPAPGAAQELRRKAPQLRSPLLPMQSFNEMHKRRVAYVAEMLKVMKRTEIEKCHVCHAPLCTMHERVDGKKTGLPVVKGLEDSEGKPCSERCCILTIRGESVEKLPLPMPFWSDPEEEVFQLLLKKGISFCSITHRFHTMWQIAGHDGFVERRSCQMIYDYALASELFIEQKTTQKKAAKNNNAYRTFCAMRGEQEMTNQHQLIPCDHDGSCCGQRKGGAGGYCRCASLSIACTKRCGCAEECVNRFPGCRCGPGQCGTTRCPCYLASWECDPDTCHSCQCDFAGIENGVPVEGAIVCRNTQIQRLVQKKIYTDESTIAGIGCFIDEEATKGELISEYCGEVISTAETERRGHVYDTQRLSYVFKINAEQDIDASRAGNVIRFANHSKYPNCYARVCIVDGSHRIGIFARRALSPGEELLFDYGYSRTHSVAFSFVERNRSEIRDKKSERKDVEAESEEEGESVKKMEKKKEKPSRKKC